MLVVEKEVGLEWLPLEMRVLRRARHATAQLAARVQRASSSPVAAKEEWRRGGGAAQRSRDDYVFIAC